MAPVDGVIAVRPPEGDPLAPLRDSVRQLGPDERRLIELIAERLAAGRTQYGELVLATDRRDFTIEASEEALDAAVYLAARLLKERIS